MSNKLLGLSVVAALSIGLSGCGGGDSSSSTQTGVGYYVDSAVSGVHYQCGDQNGTTDAEGKFTFQKGEDCTFTLGDVVLKKVPSAELVNEAKIVENNVTVAAFLQTLDVDGNASNGIEITPDVVKAVATVLQTNKEIPVTQSDLSEVFNTLKSDVKEYKGTVVDQVQAQKHLEKTQTDVTTALLAGRTFYVVHISDKEHFIGKATFNSKMTENSWKGLVNDSDIEQDPISVEGNKIVWPNDESYTVIKEQHEKYIIAADFNADGTNDGASYLFNSQSDAEAFYYKKFPKNPTTPSTETVKPIVPYTQSVTVAYNGKTMTMKAGADGDFKVVSSNGNPALSLAEGIDSLKVSQMIIQEYIKGDFPKEGVSTIAITKDFKAGTEHIVGTSAAHGDIDCTNKYKSPLPLTITNENIDYNSEFDDNDRTETTCPAWVNADDDSEAEPKNFEMVSNATITAASGKVSHISRYISLK